jgi:hypothetical protein
VHVRTVPSEVGQAFSRLAQLFHDGGGRRISLHVRINRVEFAASGSDIAPEAAADNALRSTRAVCVSTNKE